jgi:peptidoglycan/LPS O-acetylase OafA/YrhL
MEKESRIDILDSYRFIAILSVMLYHYYSRWTPPQNNVSYYPYGSGYDHFSLGWLGVQFFFIISGFVIAFTLTRTGSFTEFWKKRLIRLLPSMFHECPLK